MSQFSEKITIIIPVLNEAENIETTLSKLTNNLDVELIVVDGGSRDRTVEIVQNLKIKVVVSKQLGRAKQMNLGASVANGNILIFLHADTNLPINYQEIVKEILSQSKVVAGAFKLKIDSKKKCLRIVELMVNLRSRLFSLPYGDQAIFFKKSIFEELGGYSDLPIMEDFELIQRLKRRGKIQIASAQVITSSRRWDKLGVFKTTLINQLVIIGYYLGISPTKLRQLYSHKNN
ncbi:MAG: TIGR04283 family arsenosugar biosynthesis glycosyltransferase [Xenococcaceae cyanobacterium]